eukprot:7179505-Pyramimonas_sp.AAC.1
MHRRRRRCVACASPMHRRCVADVPAMRRDPPTSSTPTPSRRPLDMGRQCGGQCARKHRKLSASAAAS